MTEEVLATPGVANADFEPFNVSEMFDFKYKEDVEACFKHLKTREINVPDKHEISIKGHDSLIDLSPCIGIYQEASFFKGYDIDQAIEYASSTHPDRPRIKIPEDATIDDKILILTAYETTLNRYCTQVKTPFVTEEQCTELHTRLKTVFSPRELVQQDICIFFPSGSKMCQINGRLDVLKDNVVWELKYTTDLGHEDYLQCAIYMIAMQLEKGMLWNTRKNTMFEITIPDRQALMDAVVGTITKGVVNKYIDVGDLLTPFSVVKNSLQDVQSKQNTAVYSREWYKLFTCILGYRLGDWDIPHLRTKRLSNKQRAEWINLFNNSEKRFTVNTWKECGRERNRSKTLPEAEVKDLLLAMQNFDG